MSETEVVTLDDRDPRIIYSKGWWTSGGSTDYNQTTSVCGFLNSYFHFTFSGTGISVYGSVPVNTTNLSSYTLDGASPVTYASPNLTAPYTSKQLMYQSPTLADGTHLLTMTCLTSFGVPYQFPVAGQIYFDYLVYEPGASDTGGTGGSATSTVVPASTVAQTSSGIETAVLSTAAATTSTSELATTAKSTSTPVSSAGVDTAATNTTPLTVTTSATTLATVTSSGTISASSASAVGPSQTALSSTGAAGRQRANLGVVLPAVLVPSIFAILALLGAMVCLRRRRRQAKTDATNVIYRRFEDDSNGPVTPFAGNARPTSLDDPPSDGPPPFYSDTTRRTSSGILEQDPPLSTSYDTLSGFPPLPSKLQSRSSVDASLTTVRETSAAPLMQHLDGGVSLGGGSEAARSEVSVEVPPTYRTYSVS